MKFAFFFDLDGVLSDSSEGLIMCFRAALKAIDGPPADSDQLRQFLGSPLPVFFRALMPNVTEAAIRRGMKAFRAAYERDGIYCNQLYPGVMDMLRAAHRSRFPVVIVTSKPATYARRIVRDLKLTTFVGEVVGANLDETDTKASLIAAALGALPERPVQGLMLGDRHYDVDGALANGLDPIGALWGYGTREELERAGCREFASSPDDFRGRFIEPACSTRSIRDDAEG